MSQVLSLKGMNAWYGKFVDSIYNPSSNETSICQDPLSLLAFIYPSTFPLNYSATTCSTPIKSHQNERDPKAV